MKPHNCFPFRVCTLLVWLIGVTCLQSFGQTGATGNSPGFAVVELFTSQGDLNSNAAEEIFSAVVADARKNKKPVYCIAHHVDFWNRFGWKDPFSDFRSTSRLQNYTSAFRLKETYTPFAVLNGIHILNPADRKSVFENVAAALNKPPTLVPEISWAVANDTLEITYALSVSQKFDAKGGQYLTAALVENGLVTRVTDGDNAGKTLHNDGITRLWHTQNLASAKGVVRVALHGLKPAPGLQLMLLVQDKATRRYLGAAGVPFAP